MNKAATPYEAEKPQCYPDTLYELSGINGVRASRWHTGGGAAPFGSNQTAFSGLTTHINGPADETVDLADFNVNDGDFPTTGSISGTSQELYTTWLYAPQPFTLRDNNGNTGEFLDFYVGGKGQVPVVQSSFGVTGRAQVGLGVIGSYGPGLYQLIGRVNDFSAAGGLNIQWSLDGGTTFSAIPAENLYLSEPAIECRKVWCCDDGLQYDRPGGQAFKVDPATMSWCEIPCPVVPEEKVPDYEIAIQDGCDDLGQGDSDLFVNVTREILLVDGVAQTTFYTDYGNDAQAEYALVGSFVDCDTGELLEEPVNPVDCHTAAITEAYAPVGTQGVNVDRWIASAVTGLPVTATPSDVFTGAIDGVTGMPQHANGPADTSVVETDFLVSDGNRGQDQTQAWGYIYNTENIILRDRVAWAESVRYYVGKCCGPVVEAGEVAYPATDQNLLLQTALEPGIHFIGVQIFDFSAWSGMDLQYSTDGGTTWARVPANWIYADKPRLQTCPVKACFDEDGRVTLADLETDAPLGSEYTLKRPTLCAAVAVVSSTPSHAPETFYQIDPDAENGVAVQYWGDNAAPHGDVSAIFTGFDGHLNGAADGVGVHNDFVFNDVNVAADTGATQQATDQLTGAAYVHFDKPVLLREVNANSGERLAFWLGECCGAFEKVLERAGVDTDGVDRGLFGGASANPPVALSAGIHRLGFQMSDFSASGGIQVQMSEDDGATWINIPVGSIFTTKPSVTEVKGWRCTDGKFWNGDLSEELDASEWSCTDPRQCEIGAQVLVDA